MSMEVPKGYRGRIDAANARRARNAASSDVKAQRQALLIAKFEEDSRGPVHETDLTPPRQFVETPVHNPLNDAGGFDPNTDAYGFKMDDEDATSQPIVEAPAAPAEPEEADPVPAAPKKRKSAAQE